LSLAVLHVGSAMGVFHWSKQTKQMAWDQQDFFEGASGVLVSIMVVSALVLSLSVGLFGTISEQEFILGDIRHELVPPEDTADRRGYRKHLVGLLEAEGFNFTRTVWHGYPKVLDVRAILLREYPGRIDVTQDYYSDLNHAYHLVKDVVKDKYVRIGGCSSVIGRLYGSSVLLEIVALVTSMFFYIALMISCVRREVDMGHGQSLVAFMTVLKPAAIGMIIEVLGGLVCFVWGLVELCRVRFPAPLASADLMMIYMFGLLVPLCVIGLIFAAAAISWAWRAQRQRVSVDQQELEMYCETHAGQFLVSIGMEEHVGAFYDANMDERKLKMASLDQLVSLLNLPLGDALDIWKAAQEPPSRQSSGKARLPMLRMQGNNFMQAGIKVSASRRQVRTLQQAREMSTLSF